jgi:hypothetical protein
MQESRLKPSLFYMRTIARAGTLASGASKYARHAGSAGSKAAKLFLLSLRDAVGSASNIPLLGALVAALRYTWADA